MTTLGEDGAGESDTALPDQPNFSRDIQPIFARACTGCHGGVTQAGDISFVYASSILPPDGWVIEPGKPDESILFERITSSDPDERMPPPEEHPAPLSDREIELIRRWIEQGAVWQGHWSRHPLDQPNLPLDPVGQTWAKQPFDHFVWHGLRQRDLEPAAEAPPEQWLRRASFDLIGLPPPLEMLEELERRLSETQDTFGRDRVYAEFVDRLLASKHFGERWAAMWMDLARYADSQGYEKDPHRDMWPFRDWLIAAFNNDMPYDEFTLKQLAGDLLPDATFEDLVATAFHRNTQTNTEGGTDDEEYRVASAIDRLNTTWTVWQATTFGCVQCHSHPYDPYENLEFYAGLALFNSSEDCDLNSDFPTLPYLQDPQQREQWMELKRQQHSAMSQLDQLGQQAASQAKWSSLPIFELRSTSGQIGVADGEVRVLAGTVAVGSTYTLSSRVGSLTALRLTILPESDNPADWPEQGSVLSQLVVKVTGAEGASREVPLEAVIPDYRTGSYDCEDLLQPNAAGFGGYPKLFQPRSVVVTLQEKLDLTDDELLELQLVQKASVTGGLSNHLRRFTLEFTDSSVLSQLATTSSFGDLRKHIQQLDAQYRAFQGTALPIMQQRPVEGTRATRQFLRGNWLERGELVEAGIPQIFQVDPDSPLSVTNRLEFARWLTSSENPLAARVWVNRIWAELFGIGIVETLEDFGVSGQQPSHPELLDHLAHSMQHEYAWSLKTLLKSLVLSATYRQDSRVSPGLREQDPQNRWLARGPRTRLTAEMVRDQALLASGMLVAKIGGPSVMPPQPDGVWQQAYSSAKWEVATGEDRYRRGLYTYWKRTSPYPGFMMFDTPTRDICSPRRIATNTPLQALVTLNSEVYAELAASLASRCLEETGQLPERAIQRMYLRIIGRAPSVEDLRDLQTLHQQLVQQREQEQALERPPSPKRADVYAQRLSPLGIVALAILNSDLALTK